MAMRAQDQEAKVLPTSTTISATDPRLESQVTNVMDTKPRTPSVEKIKQLELLLNESNEALAAIMLENKTKAQSLSKKPDASVTSTSLSTLQNPVKPVTQGHCNLTTKRKRSAIFIPPVPAENSTKSATEVSICKFKFTGGAKPSLQV